MKNVLLIDYQNTFLVKANPNSVFKSLTQQIDKWWTEDFKGSADKLNNEFTVQFGTTFKTMKVMELIPNKKMVWLCIDTLIDIPELPNNTEWKDTKIVWELQNDNETTKITLTHFGLTPEVKCYSICEQGWESFLNSLKQFVETNIGLPFKKN